MRTCACGKQYDGSALTCLACYEKQSKQWYEYRERTKVHYKIGDRVYIVKADSRSVNLPNHIHSGRTGTIKKIEWADGQTILTSTTTYWVLLDGAEQYGLQGYQESDLSVIRE